MSEQASGTRKGEELDAEVLFHHLSGTIQGLDSPPEIRQFKGGFSNLTYLLTCGENEWILRRPPFGSRGGSAHNMDREFTILKLLEPVYPKSPKPVLFESDENVIGCPFFVMERIKGSIIRAGKPVEMADADQSSQFYRSLGEAAIDALVELHALDIKPNPELGGNPNGYIERQTEGWSRRFLNALTDDAPNPENVIGWLSDNLPEQRYQSFIHNDFKFDNLVLQNFSHPVKIKGVLDWEMSTWGDPLADLGTTLAYWIEAGDSPALRMFGATIHPGNLTRDEVIQHYAQKSGRDLTDIRFYYVLGLFKVAGIVQQIYYRYKKGATQDERFAMLGMVVKACFEKMEEEIGG